MMRRYSPQGTYLLGHKKSRVQKKHIRIKMKTESPYAYRGFKVYFYDYIKDNVAFSSKPIFDGLAPFSIKEANKIRNSSVQQAWI